MPKYQVTLSMAVDAEDESKAVALFDSYVDDQSMDCYEVTKIGASDDEEQLEEQDVNEPDEGDYVLQAAGRLGALTEVRQDGKMLFCSPEETDCFAYIRAHAERENFFPGVWRLSDHGNWSLVENFDYDKV